MQITRWTDETGASLEQIESILLSVHNDEQSDTSTGYVNWIIIKQFTNNKTEVLNGKLLNTICLHFQWIRSLRGWGLMMILYQRKQEL